MSLDRKIGKSNTHKPDIKHYSPKNGCMISADSYLEKKKCLALELDPSVKRYMTQPDSIYYSFDGKILRYTPDFLVYSLNGWEFWEMKPFYKTLDEEFIRKHSVREEFYKNVLERPLRIVTEEGLTKREYIANMEQLVAYIGHYQNEKITQRIIAKLATLKEFTVIDAEKVATDHKQSPDYAWALLANQKLTFDHNLLLNRLTKLEVNTNA